MFASLGNQVQTKLSNVRGATAGRIDANNADTSDARLKLPRTKMTGVKPKPVAKVKVTPKNKCTAATASRRAGTTLKPVSPKPKPNTKLSVAQSNPKTRAIKVAKPQPQLSASKPKPKVMHASSTSKPARGMTRTAAAVVKRTAPATRTAPKNTRTIKKTKVCSCQKTSFFEY